MRIEWIDNKSYQLKGFIQHNGPSLRDGHYLAFLELNGQWQCFNDEQLIIVSHEEALEAAQNAYILYFEQLEEATK